jgi:hypothetical protein
MLSISTLRPIIEQMAGEHIPLIAEEGTARVVIQGSGPDLVVRGVRVRYTWARIDAALGRLMANHSLSVDELGGGPDALGLVSLLAHALPSHLRPVGDEGLLVLVQNDGSPIHQHADMSGPMQRTLWRRKRR